MAVINTHVGVSITQMRLDTSYTFYTNFKIPHYRTYSCCLARSQVRCCENSTDVPVVWFKSGYAELCELASNLNAQRLSEPRRKRREDDSTEPHVTTPGYSWVNNDCTRHHISTGRLKSPLNAAIADFAVLPICFVSRISSKQ